MEFIDTLRQEDTEEDFIESVEDRINKYNYWKINTRPGTSGPFNNKNRFSLSNSKRCRVLNEKSLGLSQLHYSRQHEKSPPETEECKSEFQSLFKKKIPKISKQLITRNSFRPPRPDFGSEGFLVVNVLDTGVGMTEEEVERIFKPYSKANSQVIKVFGGTGLGLYITK